MAEIGVCVQTHKKLGTTRYCHTRDCGTLYGALQVIMQHIFNPMIDLAVTPPIAKQLRHPQDVVSSGE
jgi:hypothetical protein